MTQCCQECDYQDAEEMKAPVMFKQDEKEPEEI